MSGFMSNCDEFRFLLNDFRHNTRYDEEIDLDQKVFFIARLFQPVGGLIPQTSILRVVSEARVIVFKEIKVTHR